MYVIMEPLCFQSKALEVVNMAPSYSGSDLEGPFKQRRRKGNIESNVTERVILLKQQNKDRVSPGQKIEQSVLLLQAPETMSNTIWQMSVNTCHMHMHMLRLPWLHKCKSNNQPDGSSSSLCATACSVLHEFFDAGWSCSLTWNVSGNSNCCY